jgi:hypothetical protein
MQHYDILTQVALINAGNILPSQILGLLNNYKAKKRWEEHASLINFLINETRVNKN